MMIQPIGRISTPFSDKFAIPRQAQIVPQAIGVMHFLKNYRHVDSFNGLEDHSHYWLIWGFHHHQTQKKSLMVRPPRLGGNRRVGVFATRSPFRPNPLGISVVKLEEVNRNDFSATFSGVDMLSGTPIYDLKPYIPYADTCLAATSRWAESVPSKVFLVTFAPVAERAIRKFEDKTNNHLYALVCELLAYDPRPAYRKKLDDGTIYATTLYDINIKWRIDLEKNAVYVLSAEQRINNKERNEKNLF